MKNLKTYFGFTIGPIYEMMSHSKKTRELWFSSYLFSFYMRNLYRELKDDFEIIIPQIDFEKLPTSKAGFFPDHIIGDCKGLDREEALKKISAANSKVKEELKKTINELIENESQRQVVLQIGKRKGEENNAAKGFADVSKKVSDIVEYYLETNFICLELEEEKKANEIVEEIEKHLYALECKRTFTLGKNENTCFRCKTLPSVVTVREPYDTPEEYALCPFCFFKLRAHHSEIIKELTGLKKERPFESVGEISAGELKEKYDNVYHKVFEKLKTGEIEDLNESDFKRNGESDLKNYHKYLAIIQADGDYLGKIINETKDPKQLSENLFSFSLAVHNNLNSYGAYPVYLGGDDLLVFAPLYYNGNTVFDLVQNIYDMYTKNVQSSGTVPTISFGVNVFYYKSPLSSALQDVYHQLNHIAKREDGKNTLALLLTQHSGQKTTLKFRNSSGELESFNELLKGSLTDSKKYPEGIHHNLMKYRTVLTNLNSTKQIEYYRENRFNEDIHETFSNGLDLVFKMLSQKLTKLNGSQKILHGTDAEEKFGEFISELRFIKFLVGEKS